MALASWSSRRIAAMWLGALVLQMAIIAVPATLGMRAIKRDWPRVRQQALLQDSAWKGQEDADSISRAQQVTIARSEKRFHVRADGQTTFAVVGMPSSRPDPKRVAELTKSTRLVAGILIAVVLGAIPLTMISLTIAWLIVRRPPEESSPVAA